MNTPTHPAVEGPMGNRRALSRSTSPRRRTAGRSLSLLFPVLALVVACDDSVAPGLDIEADPLVDALPGEVLASTDSELTSALLSDASALVGQSAADAAEQSFAEAQSLYMSGDAERAAVAAAEGRMVLAAALLDSQGNPALAEMRSRTDVLVAAFDDDELASGPRVRAALTTLMDRAAAAAADGRPADAMSNLILAGQLADQGLVDDDTDGDRHSRRARFAVARAHSAVSLATRLLEDGATDSQQRLLERATELARLATVAYEEEAFRRAVALAHRSVHTALFAVIDSDGPSDEEIREIVDLAETLLEEAKSISEPTTAQERMIRLAEKQLQKGLRKIEAGRVRGVALVWRSAVTSDVALKIEDSEG